MPQFTKTFTAVQFDGKNIEQFKSELGLYDISLSFSSGTSKLQTPTQTLRIISGYDVFVLDPTDWLYRDDDNKERLYRLSDESFKELFRKSINV